jgi:GNAT superfamily N-acetyltransferase
MGYKMADNNKKTSSAFNERSAALHTFEFMKQSVHVVDPANPRSMALLAQAYHEVYKAAFPIDAEREPLEKWLELLAKPTPDVSLVVVIVGKDIDTPHPVIKGVATTEYYTKQDVGQLAYVAISPECRNEGLGRVMVEVRKKALLQIAKRNGGTLKGVFIGCNDPEKVKPEEDSFDPSIRMGIFQKWGARIMPIDFVLPPLKKESERCDKFKILAYPHPETGEYPSPEALRAFINGLYASLAPYSDVPPHENPDYIKIMRQIDVLRQDNPPPKNKPPSP